MQFAKDSFYMALRDRLKTTNAQRTIEIAGETRPAVVVAENECAGSTDEFVETFLIDWRQTDRGEGACPMSLQCGITFRTVGAEERCGIDRGRTMAALQRELMAITKSNSVAKQDFCGERPVDLGTRVFWTEPKFGAVEPKGSMLECKAEMRVYFYPEAK